MPCFQFVNYVVSLIIIIIICLFRTSGTIMKWYKYKWRICNKITIHMHHIWAVHRVTRVRIHLSFKQYANLISQFSNIYNMHFPRSDQTIRMNQILVSDRHCLYMLWTLLSLVLDHLFQYQQCWQCFRTDNHRSSSIAGWCILHSHQLCPSYGGHCKCWCC